MTAPSVKMVRGNCLEKLRELGEQSVHTVVTSPPYWGLRDYGIQSTLWGGDTFCCHEWGQVGEKIRGGPSGDTPTLQGRDQSGRDQVRKIATGCFCAKCGGWFGVHGLEPTPDLYLKHAVMVAREVWRVLRDDGTMWLNIGDTYTGGKAKTVNSNGYEDPGWTNEQKRALAPGLKPKDLCGIPWRVALALQADGWYLRADIIWHKPNPMPESAKDRPTKAHEYIFLLTKSERYYYDGDAIKEPATGGAHSRGHGVNPKAKFPNGWDTTVGDGGHGAIHKNGRAKGTKQNESFSAAVTGLVDSRNKRSVWTVPTAPYPEAHFATFPPDLIKPCILAGCPVGGTVLDHFGGSGTTGQVALELGRSAILIDLNPSYSDLQNDRTNVTPGLAL